MKTTVSSTIAQSTEPFSRHFTFSDDIMWIARVCATQLPDYKAAHVGMGSMETKGDEFNRLEVIMLYTSDDPRMEERPAAVYARNDRGHMVKVDGVHRGSGWQAVTREGRALKVGDTIAAESGSVFLYKSLTPPRLHGMQGRLHMEDIEGDVLNMHPATFHVRITNFTR